MNEVQIIAYIRALVAAKNWHAFDILMDQLSNINKPLHYKALKLAINIGAYTRGGN